MRTASTQRSGSALFHGAIAVVMGLVPFAMEMLVFQLVLVDDARYRVLLGRVERRQRAGASFEKSTDHQRFG